MRLHRSSFLTDTLGTALRTIGAGLILVLLSPLNTAVAQTEEDTLLRASNAGEFVEFGHSVAIDGDRAIVGVSGEVGPSSTGAAYVFERSGGSWQEVQILRASNGESGDGFGHSVAIDGGRAIVGAHFEAGPSNSQTSPGAAYVFERSGGSWPKNEDQILRAANADSRDEFGGTVSISGDRAIVAAEYEDGSSNNLVDAGAVYAFERTTSGWNQTDDQILRASNAGTDIKDLNDRFGHSVALDGYRAIVGPHSEAGPSNNGSSVGAAYVFERSGGRWQEVQLLRASNTSKGDAFGHSVAISGGRAIVGSFQLTEAYVFERGAGSWAQNKDQRVGGSNTVINDDFGWSVAIDGGRAIVGARKEDGPSDNIGRAGAAYVFEDALVASASATVDGDGLTSFGGTGTEIDFSGVGGFGEVTVKQYDEGPSTTDGIGASNVSNDRVTITSAFSFSSAEVQLSVSVFDGVNDPSDLTIYKRAEGASSFTALTPTNVNENGTPNDISDDECTPLRARSASLSLRAIRNRCRWN